MSDSKAMYSWSSNRQTTAGDVLFSKKICYFPICVYSKETKSGFDSNPSVMDHVTPSFNIKDHLMIISSEFN